MDRRRRRVCERRSPPPPERRFTALRRRATPRSLQSSPAQSDVDRDIARRSPMVAAALRGSRRSSGEGGGSCMLAPRSHSIPSHSHPAEGLGGSRSLAATQPPIRRTPGHQGPPWPSAPAAARPRPTHRRHRPRVGRTSCSRLSQWGTGNALRLFGSRVGQPRGRRAQSIKNTSALLIRTNCSQRYPLFWFVWGKNAVLYETLCFTKKRCFV